MGVKPQLKKNPHPCPFGPFANGFEPETIIMSISGVKKSGTFLPTFPDPPNGIWPLKFIACGAWHLIRDNWDVTLTYSGLVLSVLALSVPYDVGFSGSCALTDSFKIDNNLLFPANYQSTGIASGVLGLSGFSLPEVWKNAPLFGVPPIEGYFAEDLPATNFPRYIRYASHRDHTNLKIVGNF